MFTGVRFSPRVLGGFLALTLAVACASGSRRLRLADGSYELKCDHALSKCLMEIEQTCADSGYEILRAAEKRGRVGPLELSTEIVTSEAVVRCRRPDA
jgi:hypothetical protein